ncbi:MAG: hypothetical protein ACJAS9_000156 [Polaribacter sp.]|jgi:hypothetical protein
MISFWENSMKVVFKKIPKAALYFYAIGLVLIIIGLLSFFSESKLMSAVLTQQVFISGAIIVACGSVINTIFQFKNKTP